MWEGLNMCPESFIEKFHCTFLVWIIGWTTTTTTTTATTTNQLNLIALCLLLKLLAYFFSYSMKIVATTSRWVWVYTWAVTSSPPSRIFKWQQIFASSARGVKFRRVLEFSLSNTLLESVQTTRFSRVVYWLGVLWTQCVAAVVFLQRLRW